MNKEYLKWLARWKRSAREFYQEPDQFVPCSSSHSTFISSEQAPLTSSLIPPNAIHEVHGTSAFNFQTALIEINIAVTLVRSECPVNSIAILTPYLAQVKLYCKALAVFPELQGVNIVHTVDASHGDQWNIVIIDLVRMGPGATGGISFISAYRRLNVALSRAKLGRFVIGNRAMTLDVHTAHGVRCLRNLIEHHVNNNWIVTLTGDVVEGMVRQGLCPAELRFHKLISNININMWKAVALILLLSLTSL